MTGSSHLRGLFRFLDSCGSARSHQDLVRNVGAAFAQYGFGGWAYQAPKADPDHAPLILHNFPDGWAQHYTASRYNRIDPVITIGGRLTSPFRWSCLIAPGKLTKEVRDFLDEAADRGLRDGVGIPIINCSGPNCMFSFSSDLSHAGIDRQLRQHSDGLMAIAYAFHNLAQQLAAPERGAVQMGLLTSREKECLVWSSAGKTSWEIGAILGLQERTVNFHLSNAKLKLGATTRQQAIAIAIVQGHISP